MNSLFKLKLFLIRQGKCTACLDKPKLKYCGRCLNTRLEPEVLEAITVVDLAAKFDENASQVFENISNDDYVTPPQDSYFSRIKEKKRKLERLYTQLEAAPGTHDQKKVFDHLIREALN